MRGVTLACALALAGLAAGCTEQPGLTDVDPVFDFTNNPDNGNPMIERYGWRGWVAFEDPDAGLFAILATSNFELGCRPITYLTWHHEQDVVHDPAGKVKMLTRNRDAYIIVYQGSFIPPGAGRCAALAAARLAEGVGQFTWTDNDVMAWNYDNKNHNSYGVTSQAKLAGVDGENVHFNMTHRCTWDGEDFATEKCHTKINLE